MSGQVYQIRAYICGLEVPITNVQVSSAKDSVWAASATMPWSPFLTKLPKNTKITVFRRNTDLFDRSDYQNFRLMFCGVIAGITEAKAWKGIAQITLQIQADASIFQWRKRIITPLELALSKSVHDLYQEHDAEVVATLGTLQGVVNQTYGHLTKCEDKNATKAVALFLTSTPTTNAAEATQANANCKYKTIVTGTESDSKEPQYGHMSPYMQRYYARYRQHDRITYVDLPQVWRDALLAAEQWQVISRQIETVNGMVSYWDCARYIVNQFQGDLLMIPDATLVDPSAKGDTASFIPKQKWVGEGDHKALAELIVMPKNIFGKVPYCNIIFPDQIQQRVYSVNHGAETTRVYMTGEAVPGSAANANSAILQWKTCGPLGLSGFFASMNLAKDTVAGVRSDYESYHGVMPLVCPIPQFLARKIEERKFTEERTTVAPTNPMMQTLNYEFVVGFSQKYALQLVVSPDVEVVPGAPIIILDEGGEHLVAYCHGISYAWDANGMVSSNIQVGYPHHYSFNMEGAVHYGNPFSDSSGESATYVDKYAALIGCAISKDTHIKLAEDYYTMWKLDYNRDSRRVKYDNKRTKVVRDVCTMEEYVKFMGGNWEEVKSQPINIETGLTTLGVTLIKKFDSEKEAAELSSSSYRWFNDMTQQPESSVTDVPNYEDLGKPGTIIPYQYMSGIVDAHLKYLWQIGHFVSV